MASLTRQMVSFCLIAVTLKMTVAFWVNNPSWLTGDDPSTNGHQLRNISLITADPEVDIAEIERMVKKCLQVTDVCCSNETARQNEQVFGECMGHCIRYETVDDSCLNYDYIQEIEANGREPTMDSE